MKNFDSRVFGISDFVEWDKNSQLILNPAFQRRSVWSEKAKSYLIDTILRGKPIPKFFIRQTINVTTKSSIREVVDGQQRLRTILSFIKDGFAVSRSHNKELGGLRYSQLPPDYQAQFLSYEVSVDFLINLPDAEVLDIFSRLNSYAVVLNEQERLNANHFGPFKILADDIARKYNSYWRTQKILSDNQILRMQEVNLSADLLISILDGIRSKKQIKKYYDDYENNFAEDPDAIGLEFDSILASIGLLYPDGISNKEFRRPVMFYTLFTTVAHCRFGIKNITTAPPLRLITEREIQRARNAFDIVDQIFSVDDVGRLTASQRQFVTDTQRATTDQSVRLRRTQFLLDQLLID